MNKRFNIQKQKREVKGSEGESTTYQTYELKKRKHDSKWREQYLRRKEEHTVSIYV